MSSPDDDLDDLQLSAEAQKALKEFYDEQNEKLLSHCDNEEKDATNVKFDENWVSNLSKFEKLFIQYIFKAIDVRITINILLKKCLFFNCSITTRN